MDSEGRAKHFSSVHRWNPSEGRPGCGLGAPGAQSACGGSLHWHTGCAAGAGNALLVLRLLRAMCDHNHDSLGAVPCGSGVGGGGYYRCSGVVDVAGADCSGRDDGGCCWGPEGAAADGATDLKRQRRVSARVRVQHEPEKGRRHWHHHHWHCSALHYSESDADQSGNGDSVPVRLEDASCRCQMLCWIR